jgi:hypothetical protein
MPSMLKGVCTVVRCPCTIAVASTCPSQTLYNCGQHEVYLPWWHQRMCMRSRLKGLCTAVHWRHSSCHQCMHPLTCPTLVSTKRTCHASNNANNACACAAGLREVPTTVCWLRSGWCCQRMQLYAMYELWPAQSVPACVNKSAAHNSRNRIQQAACTASGGKS